MNQNATNEPDLLEGEDKPQINRDAPATPVLLDDTESPDTGEQQERQDAFDAGASKWKGNLLEPYSSSRDALFSRLRSAMGAPDIKEAIMDPSLFVADAHLILFLCSHDEHYLVTRMGSQSDLLVDMMRWADENIQTQDTNEAVTLALTVFLSKTTNSAEQKPDDSSDDHELGN